jgi:hypothetical protein
MATETRQPYPIRHFIGETEYVFTVKRVDWGFVASAANEPARAACLGYFGRSQADRVQDWECERAKLADLRSVTLAAAQKHATRAVNS